MIYLDTSAAMKLVRPEEHSAALSRWIGERPGMAVLSSVLINVELSRATHRSAPDQLMRSVEVLRGVGTVSLSASVTVKAAGYPDAELRSLDAIHLATAQHVVSVTGHELEGFLAYDTRLLAAAERVGLPVAAPGLR